MHPKGFFRAMCDTLMRGEIWQGDICNRAKDGSLFWVSATLLMYGESDGLPTQYLSICTDITQSKANEQALRDESAIVARMSHEVHKLQRTELDPEQQRMVATIADAAQALLRLLKDSHLCP
jgi:PAS domain-containing protein